MRQDHRTRPPRAPGSPVAASVVDDEDPWESGLQGAGDDIPTNTSGNTPFAVVVERALSRRGFLGGSAALAASTALVGSVGMVKLPDLLTRLHAPTKATTLGVGGVLLASMVLSWTRGEVGLHELLITLFLFVTAPVSANLLSQAALHLRVPTRAPLPPGGSEPR